MVITKSHKVAAKLVKAFTEHSVRKTYLALCTGNKHTPLESETVRVVSGHGRSKHGAWRVYSVDDIGRTLPGGSFVKNMETRFQVLSNNVSEQADPINANADIDDEKVDEIIVVVDNRSMVTLAEGNVDERMQKKNEILLRAYPRSGRTHQIRLHCQYLGMPIKGDVKYGGVDCWNGVDCEFHSLHAESLSFEHPVTGGDLLFSAPPPLWFSNLF